MERALLNVMSNAIRYSPPNSVIQIGLTVVQENHAALPGWSRLRTKVKEGIDEGTKRFIILGAGLRQINGRFRTGV